MHDIPGGAGLPDPCQPDGFERGAVVPTVVERHAAEMMATGVASIVRLVVRVALALLAIDLLVTLGRGIYDSPVNGVNPRVADALLTFLAHLDETAWLRGHLPGWAVGVIAIAIVLAIYVAGLWFDELFAGLTATPGVAGARVAGLALDSATFVIDRGVALTSRPLGRRGEIIARLVVIASSLAAALGLLYLQPPHRWLALVEVEATFGLFATFGHYALLGLAYSAAAFLILQVLFQGPALVRLARYRHPGTITSWLAPAGGAGTTGLAVVHWSDLHVTPFADSLRTDRASTGGNQALRALVEAAVADADAIDAIIVTGDATDAGRSAEWAEFFALTAPVLAKLVLVPGNHDLNIVDPLRWEIVGDHDGCGRALREARLLAALDRVQGDRAMVLAKDGSSMITLRAYLAPHATVLALFYDHPTPPQAAVVRACFRHAFPMAVALPGGFYVHVFDSNDRAGNVATNAFGRIEDGALERFVVLSRLLGDAGQFIALHHHLGYPPSIHERGWLERRAARFLVLQNARELAIRIRGLGHTVVLHGHRHIGYEGQLDGDIDIMSARSSTLGDSYRGVHTPGFRRIRIERAGERGTRVTAVTGS